MVRRGGGLCAAAASRVRAARRGARGVHVEPYGPNPNPNPRPSPSPNQAGSSTTSGPSRPQARSTLRSGASTSTRSAVGRPRSCPTSRRRRAGSLPRSQVPSPLQRRSAFRRRRNPRPRRSAGPRPGACLSKLVTLRLETSSCRTLDERRVHLIGYRTFRRE